MADFLSRLADRTLGLSETVRPQIAPLFAPGLNLPADDAASRANDAPTWSPDPPADQRQSAQSRTRGLREPGGTSAASGPATGAARSQRHRPDEARSAVDRAPADTAHHLLTPDPTPRRPALAAPLTPPSEPAMPLAGTPDHKHAEHPHASPAPAPGREGPRVRAAPSPTAGREGRGVRAVSGERVEDAEHQRPAAATPEPTVRVTIGRVDVRAIFPAPRPAPTPPRTGPTLTVEEYIKQRAERRR